MSDATIQPPKNPFTATFTPPGSKSITNRALILAALAAGKSSLSNVLFADDTRIMIAALATLGFELEADEPNRRVDVAGRAGAIPAPTAELFCGNSGTSLRFLTALCALGSGRYVLDGVERMRQRPVGDLAEMLRHLGVRTDYKDRAGFPPIIVQSHGLPGGMLRAGAAQSSQFLSAVLMSSPYARHEVHVDLIEPQTSWPYVAMTMRIMDSFGVTAELVRDPLTHEPKQIIVPQGRYSGRAFAIEPDASNATYFLAAAAVHPGAKITLSGLGRQSVQGDVGFADVLKRMGAAVNVDSQSITVTGTPELHGIEVDLSSMPDTAQTLAVVAAMANGRTTIHGLGTLRVKETDRLAALQNELSRFGAHVAIEGDSLIVDSPLKLRPAEIATYDDHRMAMSFAVAASKSPGIVIKDAQCVNKTYPNFFADFENILRST
jgi:3-phosphoshikimate 1-carboxyvinyltransferase